MDRDEEQELYKRHDTLGLTIPSTVSIIGCGGTGTWTAIFCALSGVKTMHFFDDDTIEAHNLSRLPFDYPESIGKKKTEVLAAFIKRMRPDIELYTYEGVHNDSDLFRIIGDVAFDCNDDHRIQKLISKYCKKTGMKYLGIGCNANHVTVKSDIDKLWGEGNGNRYQVTPMFFIPPVLASCCGLWNLISKKKTKIDILQSVSYMFTEPSHGETASECKECPLFNHCDGCQTHNSEPFVVCSCCPITRES